MGYALNRAQLIGNLGADPELRSAPSGTSVTTISVATTDRFKDKSGEWQDRTEWHNVVLWGSLADIAKQYLKKGSKVFIEGRISYRQFEGRDGNTRYVTEIVAQQLIMLGGRGDGGSGGGDSSQRNYDRGGRASDNVRQSAPEDHASDDFDDEVPF